MPGRRMARSDAPYVVPSDPNGEIIGRSEMYSSKSVCEKGTSSVKRNARGARIEDLT